MRISNTISTKGAVKLDKIPSHLYQNSMAVFDLSFPCALSSCAVNGFNNYLKDEVDFIKKLKKLMESLDGLSGHTLHDLFNSGKFRHCHALDKDKQPIAQAAIRKILERRYSLDIATSMYKQNVEGENLYQAGLADSIRVVGTHSGNVFRVLLVDYYHDFYEYSKYNVRTSVTHSYSF